MKEYYNRRAQEYEKIYRRDDPARQKELGAIRSYLLGQPSGKAVVDLACGTGFWTEPLSAGAETIVGIDIAPEVLKIASNKKSSCHANFILGDLYRLPVVPDRFDMAVAGFWFSHVSVDLTSVFLNEVARLLKPNGRLAMFDNCYDPKLSGDIIRKPNDLNQYVKRTLSDGSEYEVIKHYYTEASFRELLSQYRDILRIEATEWMQHYWYAELVRV